MWILVIHNGFSNDVENKRTGNSQDVENLKTLFEEYQDCTFNDIESAKSTEIAAILSKEGIQPLFDDDKIYFALIY